MRKMSSTCLRIAAVVLSISGVARVAPAGQQRPASSAAASRLTVFVRGVPIGTEQVTVEQSATGWTITSSGRVVPPIDIVARLVQVRYTPDWHPIELTVDGVLQGQPVRNRTNVAGTTATTAFTQGGKTDQRTDTIAADALILPSPFWGPYEALSQRLKTAPAGSTIAAYSLQASVPIEVGRSYEETIEAGGRVLRARRTAVRMLVPGNAPLEAEVWGDEGGRLLRLTIPAQSLDVVREDLASVSARRVGVSRAGDEQVRIPVIGFSLAGTISKPANLTGRGPAVILVGGSESTDRDETVFGIPIFGQLAGSLADDGFLVARYDKRGVGQSGGRPESATLTDYADDLRAVVRFVSDRKDVDRKRLAVVGHGEGGMVAVMAAARDDRITAVALIAAPGVSGADLNLQQVTHNVERSGRPDAEKQSTIDLQKKLQRAVLTGSGWEGIPPGVRRQADVPWFQSFLAFDPAKSISAMSQPLLIVQGLLDTQVAPSNADRLEALATRRKKGGAAEVVRLPGINHLLVPATTGEVDEYAALTDKHIASSVAAAISSWLRKTQIK